MKNPLLVTCLLAPVLVSGAGVDQAGTEEFFEKRIRPLLMEHCVDCHGADKQKGSLRLDHQAGWQNGGDSGPALVPGKIEESLLWKAVSYEDRDLKMPPKKKLSASQMADLKAWISAGAHDPRTEVPGAAKGGAQIKADGSFWSFQTPVKPPVPAVKNTDWAANDIDRFILAKLEAAGLSPSADASAEVLMRRLSFDLTGLPPRLSSASTKDIEAEIDAMLASPAFAERWASHFMDMTRFAESSGGGRSLPFKDAWRFRDYLIESIRDNAPLDRMITEMIAGDLLTAKNSAERRRQLTATGFLALGPTNYEEQDKGMLRMDIVDEQLDTIGKSFLGMTIGCARCHDHKFDPIPTRDYYALAGIMRSTRTLKNYTDNVAHWIDTPLPFEGDQEARLVKHEAALAKLEQEAALLKDQLRDAGSVTLRKKKQLSPQDLPGVVVDDSEAQKVGEWKSSSMYPPFIGGGYVHDINQGRGEKTLTFTPKLPVAGRYEVRVAFSGGPGRAERIPATVLHADGEDLVYFKETTEALKGLQFTTLGTWRFEASGQNFVMISNAGAEGYVTVDAVQFIPADADMPEMPAVKISGEEKGLKARLSEIDKEIKMLKKSTPARPEAMSVAEDPAPEDARVHIRGSIRNLGAPVPRGFIQVAMKGSTPVVPPDQSGRLQLAQWMTSREHPLTSRVLVNRVWHWLFGAGIVRTTDNFGVTGELPSHPELLDYLAVKFMEEGWSLKKLVKQMVMSRTYRQTSLDQRAESTEEDGQKEGEVREASGSQLLAPSSSLDPDNRLLSRMNRKRMDAECLRDAMLSAAGTLDETFGGQNVSATKVDANDQKIQNLEYGFTFDDTRRSVYTAAFRNVRHPLFEVFDFADINQPIGQRTTSTVATQALFMMNNPKVIEQARAAAARVLAETNQMSDRIVLAYRHSLSREPTAQESTLAQDYLEASISGNATEDEVRDAWARLIQTLWATPEFRYLR
jgi:mono/diheme cytochrome c family protein